jgi:hypothetical protein
MKKKISVVSSNQNTWEGEIEILSKNDKTVYVKWVVYNNKDKLVASFTNNYYIGDSQYSVDEIFSIVKDRIICYRIGRKKIFEKVILVRYFPFPVFSLVPARSPRRPCARQGTLREEEHSRKYYLYTMTSRQSIPYSLGTSSPAVSSLTF